jgi:predicted nucleotidyltransferase
MFWDTVSKGLRKILLELSNHPTIEKFTLVGGTALSLQIGHRQSEDIDLFTDEVYGSIDMNYLAEVLERNYPFYRANIGIPKNWGLVALLVNMKKQQ